VKRDDVSGAAYGGNKVRKLEYLLADAQQQELSSVLTIGAVGSNHVLATAVYARQLGLKSYAVTFPHPLRRGVERIVEATLAQDGFLTGAASSFYVPWTALAVYIQRCRAGARPYFIPMGGSSALGNVGYVTAAFELQHQILEGALPEPQVIYIALGTGGSAAGLFAGMRLCGMTTRVVGVRVASRIHGNAWRTIRQANATLRLLASFGLPFPVRPLDYDDLIVAHDHNGAGYGARTIRAHASIRLAASTESLALDETYTGKALGALIADLRSGRIGRTEPVLFWNTFSSQNLAPLICAGGQNSGYRNIEI
jgi:1-aminocyclopropane-1-carboxylate deaminase/D-cysteine desulfhydrase-like pyridoxal-dependent ACC family enzyme